MTGHPRIGFLLGRPTQFEAPFFRYAQSAGKASLRVIYVSAERASAVYDAELGRTVDWGIDLLSGYDVATLPAKHSLRWLWNELHSDRYDWLIINGYTTFSYMAAAVIARLRGIRPALRIDSVLFNAGTWRKRAKKRFVMRFLCRVFERFFATGTLTTEFLRHFGVEGERISLFPYGVDTERFGSEAKRLRSKRDSIRARFGLPAAAPVVLAIAKMTNREAPWDLIRALDGLKHNDVWTLVVGDGPLKQELEAEAKKRNLERVVFPGYVAYADLASCYAAADVFVHAVADEPWGVSVHEAIASGVPVIASSRVGAARDLVLSGRNGFVYEWSNPADLRAKLAVLLETFQDDELRRANEEVLARWNYAQMWDEIVSACSDVSTR